MRNFFEVYGKMIVGAISGWDRIRFRGTVRWLASTPGIGSYLSVNGILLKDFGKWAEGITKRVRAACAEQAERLGIPTLYLRSSKVDKEALARKVAAERGVEQGDICMFSIVEPCSAPLLRRNRATKQLDITIAPRKCVWVYHYWNDPDLGFGHTRLQTWLPLSVTVCLNGRHWLERQLQREQVGYVKDGNCFTHIEDLQRAQELFAAQQQTHWPGLLDSLLIRNCPAVREAVGHHLHYYWSADESEWATDILFGSASELDRLFPYLVHHGMLVAQSPAVMRFLGRKHAGGVLPTEVVSDLRTRYEGVRLKHWVNRNSVKMYNKAGNVLRVETTINNTRDFKVFRHPDDDDSRPPSWQKMRKGVSDLHRRAQVSQASNERYLDHMAAASVGSTLEQTLGDICRRTTRKGRRFRAINPWDADDFAMLQFIARGEIQLSGLRNRDLRAWLYPALDKGDAMTRRRASGCTTRRLALLRAHGLIKKVPKENRYLLTAKGRNVTAALLAASNADTQRLMEAAA